MSNFFPLLAIVLCFSITKSNCQALSLEEDFSTMEFKSSFESGLSYDNFSQIRLFEDYTDSAFGDIGLVTINFIRRVQYNDEPTLEFAYNNAQGLQRNFSWRVAGEARMFLKGDGKLGLGTSEPKTKLQIEDGDIYLSDINKGVIMTSSNGNCWRVTVDDSGALVSNQITCPN